jgi:hypothetical protein
MVIDLQHMWRGWNLKGKEADLKVGHHDKPIEPQDSQLESQKKVAQRHGDHWIRLVGGVEVGQQGAQHKGTRVPGSMQGAVKVQHMQPKGTDPQEVWGGQQGSET